MKKPEYILVKSTALPKIYSNVLYAKQLLSDSKNLSVTEAVKIAGISRSAFYKYRDDVFHYNGKDENNLTISVLLSDRAGVFSALTAKLFEKGVNILTINQSLPVDGIATATMTVCTDNTSVDFDKLITEVKKIDGVISIKLV